ncbi:alpha/beta fold hydrolase [Arsenicicoccus dermatophilus]|uniref:alpha/beta fold hydrolase n=1 Tax=Arsenicicoccus dermatophilus TaxID=1076331 RepID=UPI001F4C8C5D|nr:alpha/beta hydrolase [Arsenicicoccus dermatophilus]
MGPDLSHLTRVVTGLGLGLGTAAAGVTGITSRSRSLADEVENVEATYAHLCDEERVVVSEDGTVLHVEVDLPTDLDPARPVVVLSHGYTLSTKAWIFVRRRLKDAGYEVVCWDQRGHGRSGAGSRDSYRIDVLGRDLRAVVDETCAGRTFALVGHSMGGMTQMGFGRQFPELVRERCVAVAFVATSSGGQGEDRVALGDLLGRAAQRLGPYALAPLTGRQAVVEQARRVARQLEHFFTYRYSFASPVPPSLLHYASDMIMSTPVEVMQGFLRTLSEHDEREALASFAGIEALVVNGDCDLMLPPSHSERIVRRLPGAEHVVVSDAGHLLMLEHPEVVSDQILAMLERAARHEPLGERTRVQVTDLAHRRTSRSRRHQAERREQRRRAREQVELATEQTRAELARQAQRVVRGRRASGSTRVTEEDPS